MGKQSRLKQCVSSNGHFMYYFKGRHKKLEALESLNRSPSKKVSSVKEISSAPEDPVYVKSGRSMMKLAQFPYDGSMSKN